MCVWWWWHHCNTSVFSNSHLLRRLALMSVECTTGDVGLWGRNVGNCSGLEVCACVCVCVCTHVCVGVFVKKPKQGERMRWRETSFRSTDHFVQLGASVCVWPVCVQRCTWQYNLSVSIVPWIGYRDYIRWDLVVLFCFVSFLDGSAQMDPGRLWEIKERWVKARPAVWSAALGFVFFDRHRQDGLSSKNKKHIHLYFCRDFKIKASVTFSVNKQNSNESGSADYVRHQSRK